MEFCSPFDHALAHGGPAAVFLVDRGGALRFDATWTRDTWGRAPGPHAPGWVWILLRDRASGYVQMVLVTSPTLLADHPRADVRVYETQQQAVAARAEFGAMPLAKDGW